MKKILPFLSLLLITISCHNDDDYPMSQSVPDLKSYKGNIEPPTYFKKDSILFENDKIPEDTIPDKDIIHWKFPQRKGESGFHLLFLKYTVDII